MLNAISLHAAFLRTPLRIRHPKFEVVRLPLQDLSQPEPLNSSFLKEAEPLIELFGEYLTNCVYSKAGRRASAANMVVFKKAC